MLSARAGAPLSVQTVRLFLDVIMLACGSHPIPLLEQQVVQPAIAAQLDAFELMLSGERQACDLRAFHFQPPGWPHPLTVTYPMRSGGGAGKVCMLLASTLWTERLPLLHGKDSWQQYAQRLAQGHQWRSTL